MKLVRVEWSDTISGSRWISRDSIKYIKLPKIVSVGQILREDKNVLVIGHTLDEARDINDIDNDFTCGFVAIPRPMIKKIQVLSYDAKKRGRK